MGRGKDTPLAILGMACRLPGADNLAEYWELLASGRCAIVEAPPSRLNRRLHYDPRRGLLSKTYNSLGGVIQYHPFDASRCPVPARILPSAEIGHQTICQVAADACRHAGMNPFDLPLRNVGVYVGHNLGGPVGGEIIYATLVEQTAQYLRQLEAFRRLIGDQEDVFIEELVAQIRNGLPRHGCTGAPSCATQLAAAIISEAFGLSGPSMILDAACSSALQGLAMACRALQLGRIDMAIVGGASYYHVDSQMLFSRAQSASATGSRPFDAEADGLVSGEGYVAIVLKTLPRAMADGDPICGAIRGIGLSSDGRGKSLWAPRKEGQVLAIRRAYEDGVDIGRLQYIEAHATSTPVGDLTELKALADALEGQLPPGKKIPIGAVKANIGHTLEAAGLAGLVKTLLAIQHKTIPQQIHITRLNPGLDWDNAPLFVPTSNIPWPEFEDGHPRRAAINSFGIGGLNVHVVVDEYQPQAVPTSLTRRSPPSQTVSPQEPIAIVGASCIFPGARTLDAFWELLQFGRDPKCDVPPDRWDVRIGYEPGSRRPWRSPSKRGGFITDFQYDWRRHKVPPNQVAHADLLQLMILDGTDAALADAGYDRKPYDKSRVGVVVGTIFGDDFGEQLQMGFRLPDFCDQLAARLRSRGVGEEEIAAVEKAYADALLEHMPALLDETGGFTPSTLASRITKTYDWMGGAMTIDAGQASSLAAVATAVDWLSDHSCDMIVCAAGHRAMGLVTYESLSLEGKLSSDDPKSPFDAHCEGYLPGEGVGVVMLKRLADAQRDGDRIRGILRGVGVGFALSCRDAVGQAIGRAYQAAGVEPEGVSLLETSGTGSAELDREEISAVVDKLAAGERREPLAVGSVVGQIGHTQGASGMASLLAAVRSLEALQTPARFGATTPDAVVADESRLRLATEALPLKSSDANGSVVAGVTSTDQWGAAYHLVLQRGVPAKAADPTEQATPSIRAAETLTDWRIVRIGAATMAELKQRAGEAAADASAILARAATDRFSPEQSCRLAVVAREPAELAKKLNLAAQQISTSNAVSLARQDVFVNQVCSPAGRVAFLFSGQGSQYAGMLKTLVEEYPPAAEAMCRIDETLRRLGIPSFAEVAWGDGKALGSDVWLTQLSLLCADTIVFHSLQAMGIHPDYVAGHSYGEYPALAAAGAWDFENAVRGTRARCQAIEASRSTHGRMLSVAAAGPLVEQICREVGGSVYPANYNAPDQTVVGGTEADIARLEERLKADGIAAVMLAVPRPFHTPLMEEVKGPLARGLESVSFRTARVPMLSSVTNRLVASTEEARANLVAQMVSPVRWVDLVGQLADEGVSAMVEVGPRQVLTGLNGKILAGRDVATIACDDKTRSGLVRLLAVQACLESRGLMDRPRNAPVVDVFAAMTADGATGVPLASRQCTAEHWRDASGSSRPLGGNGKGGPAAQGTPAIGTPYEIGQQQGLALAETIRAIARRYSDVAGMDVPELADAVARASSLQLEPDQRDVLRGVADGAGVSLKMLTVYDAWLAAGAGDASLARRPWDGLAQVRAIGAPRRTSRINVIPVEEYLAASQNVDGRPPFDPGDRVCQRFVLRMLRTPLPDVEESLRKLNGPALIVGQNAVAVALRRQIEELGTYAVVLPRSDDIDETLAAVETIWQTHQPPHLFLVTPFDEEAIADVAREAWEPRRQRGVMLPCLVCQRWFALVSENRMVEQASVVAATAMGGDFGLSGRIDSPESGAMTGLVKALCLEVGYTTDWAFRTKVIDAPRSEPPEDLAAAMLRELRAISLFAEIGYAGGQRYVIGAIRKPVERIAGNEPTRGRPWLVTGGARGITAAVAKELGKRFGVKLHLVGSSPRPEIDPAWRNLTPEGRKELRGTLMKRALAEKRLPAELWKQVEKAIEIDRTLRDLEAAGIAAVYHACDVSNREAMARLVEEIRRNDGPLEGIIHGAGIEVACRFTKKDSRIVSKTIAAKVDGAAVLMDLTRRDPLRFFFGFGSVSGRWGAIGQTDYTLASDMLAKLIDWYRHERPECHATCFHWQPWAEIGMAARDETKGGNMLRRLAFLPPREGVRHFVDEMVAGCPEPEVLITDWKYYKGYHRDLSEKEIAETYSPTPPRSVVSELPKPAAAVPSPASDRVAMRHVMRMVEMPLEQTVRKPFAFAGPALVLGDNADAGALCEHLVRAGVEVRRLPIGESVEETLAAPQWMLDGRPVPHLFLMTGRDPEATEIGSREAWLVRRRCGVILPYLVCQKWLALVDQHGLRERASVVAATSLGGDFGLAQRVPAPEGGALTGLLKGLYLEAGGQKPGSPRVKIVDAPPGEPSDRLAEAVCCEMEVEGIDVEVAWAGGRRSVVRLARAPIEPLIREDIPRGNVWVFTGGARGITAAVAKEMGRRYGLKLHLLGKSPMPQLDPAWFGFGELEWRQLKRSLAQKAIAEGKPPGTYWDRVRRDREIDGNLRELAAAGVQATYHSCDVTDWNQLAETLQQIRETDGPIEGIVHGAGLQGPAKTIGETAPDMLEEMVDVKLDATIALLLLTRDDPLRYFVGFGSISGRFGTASAATYTLTNDMLAKLVGWYRGQRPACRAVSFHWHPWGEVGMMTRPVSQHTIMIMKMKLMPPDEGAEHLIAELRAGAPESEVLVSDSQFYETFYSREILIEAADKPGAESPLGGALIQRVIAQEPGRFAAAEIHLDPLRDPFLREHRLRDRATLPMVVALEAFAEAASLLAGDGRCVAAIRDVRIADSVRFFTDEPNDVRVDAEWTDGVVQCRLTSDFRNRRGQLVQKDRLHFSAVVELTDKPMSLTRAAAPPPSVEWHEVTYPPRDALMYHGPPLRLLKRVAIGVSEGWGEIQLPGENELAGSRNAAGWLTPSAALDACYYACGVYTWLCAEGGVTVPDSLAELRFGRAARPLEQAVVHVVCRELGMKHGLFDFTLAGEVGEVILQVQGYRCHVLR